MKSISITLLTYFLFGSTPLYSAPAYEYQWAICEPLNSAIAKLQANEALPPRQLRPTVGNLSNFDTQDFSFQKAGVQLRLRTKEKEKYNVKVTYPNESAVDRDFFSGDNAKCEWDILLGFSAKLRCSRTANGHEMSRIQADFLWKNYPQQMQELPIKPRMGPWIYTETSLVLANFSGLMLNIDATTVGQEELTEFSLQTEEASPFLQAELTRYFMSKNVSLCSEQLGRFERTKRLLGYPPSPTTQIDL